MLQDGVAAPGAAPTSSALAVPASAPAVSKPTTPRLWVDALQDGSHVLVYSTVLSLGLSGVMDELEIRSTIRSLYSIGMFGLTCFCVKLFFNIRPVADTPQSEKGVASTFKAFATGIDRFTDKVNRGLKKKMNK